MAGEIQTQYQSAKTLYALIRNRVGQIWDTGAGAFEAYATLSYADYVVSLTEQGTASAYYTGTMPAAIPAGVYSIVILQQVGGSPAETDLPVAMGDLQWGGSVTLPLSDLATSGQIGQYLPMRPFRGQMIQNFPFKMVSSADHVTPFTSGVVSGQISKDGAAFTALQSGAFTEIGLGYYKTNLTSGDLLCNTAALHFSAVGISGSNADPRDFTMILHRTSGQTV